MTRMPQDLVSFLQVSLPCTLISVLSPCPPAEDLPFADPSGPEDHDSKIGSFVEELWNAPALAMFSTGGQRVTQSTKALHEELAKLRETKEKLVECNRENRVSACID